MENKIIESMCHYENMPIILPPKHENFQIKNSDIFRVVLKT